MTDYSDLTALFDQAGSFYAPSTPSTVSDQPQLFSAGSYAASVAPSEDSQATVVPDERVGNRKVRCECCIEIGLY